MNEVQIAIVGGGPAGLSTAGALKHAGLDPVIFDRDESIGTSWLRRYDRLHLHTVRAFSGLAHYPIPRTYPKYLTRDMYAQYLQSYRNALELRVVQKCAVQGVDAGGAHGTDAPFVLRTDAGSFGARAVVIATGMFGVPVLPAFAGLEQYGGITLHASQYKSGRSYAGKRVLVVGMGNTGAEIVTDLVEQGAAFVAVSVRTSPTVVPRDVLGVPVQLFGILLSSMPPVVADAIARSLARIVLGDLTRYGLPQAQWFPFSAKRIPVIDVGFVANLKSGNIHVRPPIDNFSREGVTYADNRYEAFDAVIFATGYRPGLETLLNVPCRLREDGLPVFGCGEQAAITNFYFMGFIESHRGLLFEIERRSRRLARALARGLRAVP